VIALTPTVKAAVEARFGIPATVIPPSVDRTLFKPGSKTRTLAYMPRRNDRDVLRILDLGRANAFDLVPIHGVSLPRVAEMLSRAAIFLADGREGFGLPALEAMASGCVVVGFAAEGQADFMEDGANCLLAPLGDCERAAQTLELAERLFDEGRVSDVTQAAVETAKKFSPGREAAGLIRFWTSLSREEALHER
jgi:glycosyltransferase involved in cell wall biosynthesis